MLQSAPSAAMRNLAGVIAADHGDLDAAITILEPLATEVTEAALRYAILTNLAVACRRCGRADEAASWERQANGARPATADPVADFLLATAGREAYLGQSTAGLLQSAYPQRVALAAPGQEPDLAQAAAGSLQPGDPRAFAIAMDLAGSEFARRREKGDLESAVATVDTLEAISQVIASIPDQEPWRAAVARANHAAASLDVALDQRDLKEAHLALDSLQEAMDSLRRARRDDHPDVVAVANNLAVARVEVACAEEDPSALRTAVDGLAAACESTLRTGHPDSLTMMADLGYAELELVLLNPNRADFDEAIRLNQLAIERLGSALGPRHPLTRRVLNQLRECRRIRDVSERAARVASNLDCGSVLADVYLYLDLELDEERRTQIQQHLDECSDCLREYGIEHEVKALVAQRCGDETAPRELRERLRLKLDQLMVETERREYRGVE
jgi:mycothiol system anti-sigma-R factor